MSVDYSEPLLDLKISVRKMENHALSNNFDDALEQIKAAQVHLTKCFYMLNKEAEKKNQEAKG